MGSIVKRSLSDGRIVFYAKYRESDGTQATRKIPAKSDDDAAKRLAAIEDRVSSGQPGIVRPKAAPKVEKPKAPALTVRDLAEKFCGKAPDWKGDGGADARNPKKYRRQFWSVLKCHVLDVIGDLPANDVKRSDVVRVIDAMKGEKRRTTQKAVRHVSRLYNWASDREFVACVNPSRRQKTPKYQENNSFYTDAEVTRMLAESAAKMPDLYPILAFAYYGGLRKGELASIRWADVDLEGGRASVQRSWEHNQRKSGQAVTVHLHPRLKAILCAHYERQKPSSTDDLVFPDPVTDGMRDEFDLWGLEELIKLAKVRRFTRPWHSFRHACGTALATAGASLPEIQEALGQTTMEMARRYVKTAGEQVRVRVHALPDLAPASPDVVDLNAHRVGTDGYGPKSERTGKPGKQQIAK